MDKMEDAPGPAVSVTRSSAWSAPGHCALAPSPSNGARSGPALSHLLAGPGHNGTITMVSERGTLGEDYFLLTMI